MGAIKKITSLRMNLRTAGLLLFVIFVMNVVSAEPIAPPQLPVEASPSMSPQVDGLLLNDTVPITSGAIKKRYTYLGTRIEVVEVDLNNPYVDIQAISPNGKVATRASVSQQASQNGAIAAINADFFNIKGEGAPLGTMMRQGVLVTSPVKLNAIYSLGITSGRTARIEQFAFSGSVTSPLGATFALSGINKTPYYEEPSGIHSHVNQLHLYTDHWARTERGHDTLTTPTEVLIMGGIVQSIHIKSYYPGTVPQGGIILRGHGSAAKFLETNAVVGQALVVDYRIAPEDQWLTIIGGHSLLVDQGKAIAYGRSLSSIGSQVARTAVGISQDGKTVYMIVAEKSGTSSKGLTIKQLSELLPQLGVWKGLNLDGGGSTTFVSRPLGGFTAEPVIATQEASERPVVNGIGLFSTAPAGLAAGGVLSGPKEVLIGQEVSLKLSAYDQFFNPIEPSNFPVVWSTIGDVGTIENGVFVAKQMGEAVVNAQMDTIQLTTKLRAIGRDDIVQIAIKDMGNPEGTLSAQQRQLQITVQTASGKTIEVPSSVFKWAFEGLNADVVGNILTIQAQTSPIGTATASYEGFKATLPIYTSGETKVLSLENLKGIVFEKTPASTLGFVDVISDPLELSKNVVRLSYDFTFSSGTQAAYMTFPDKGVLLPNQTDKVTIAAYGQQGGEWIRAELIDGKGKLQRVTLATSVNWSGWQQIEIGVKAFPSPIRIKRIYAVGVETDWKLISKQGQLLFKDLVVTAPLAPIELPSAIEPLTLTVGSKVLIRGENQSEMDAAPITLAGRTLVPLRFISEALGAKVTWHPDTKNAAIWNRNQWVDLWFNTAYMVRAGKRLELDVPPSLVSGRLMIPLRAVAESLDVKVTWDGALKRVILQ